MVTLIKYGTLSGGEKYNVNVLNFDGLSTDTKPTRTFIEYGGDGREVGRTGIPNGSLYTEIDTGDTYMYDTDNTTWHKVSIGGGGGGGGFTPTTAQLDAMNSGINSTKVAQITTNETNILLKADKTTTDSLQVQINEVAQAAGTSTAETEIAQARVGTDGTVYTTLKARLDSTENNFNNITVNSNNLFDVSTAVKGGYYNSSGNITSSTSGEYSKQYIPVEAGEEYSYTRTGSQMVYCEYNANKEFIRRFSIQNVDTVKFTVSNDAYYVRLSLYGSFGFSESFVFNKGSTVVPYEPYGKLVNYEKIKGKPVTKYNYIRYEVGAGVEPEKLYIYTPINDGYLKYTFVHSVDAEINADVWRIKNAITTDLTFVDQTQLTVGGEWECAIMLQGRSDFMGGINHGDETYNSVEFIIDGKLTDVSTLTSRTEFCTLRIVQNSNLYDPNDSTTLVATHGSEHIFGSDLEINQTINWKTTETVSIAYLAMMLNSKSIVDTMYTDANYAIIDISNQSDYSFDIVGVKKISQYSEDAGVYAELECDTEKTATFKDNNGQNYHKCYFNYVSGNTNVEDGTVWKNKSIYRYVIESAYINLN